MTKVRYKTAAVVIAAIISFTAAEKAICCGPDFPCAVMVNGIHPDLPLKHFAAGKLGVIQPGWAQSYLITSYRYMSGKPLSASDQDSIMALWCKRLGGSLRYPNSAAGRYYDAPDAVVAYFVERGKILHKPPAKGSDRADFNYCRSVFDDAFANALKTLKELEKRYDQNNGNTSPAIKEWLSSQDIVFAIDLKQKPSALPVLTASSSTNKDAYLKALRQYQEASFALYADDFATAQRKFEELAANPQCPDKALAQYLAARALANSAMPPNDSALINKAMTYVRQQISGNSQSPYKPDLLDLYDMLQYEMSESDTNLDKMAEAALDTHSSRFGSAVANLTTSIDRNLTPDDYQNKEQVEKCKNLRNKMRERSDLLDWLSTFQQSDTTYSYSSEEEQKIIDAQRRVDARHCLDKWRATKSLPWLVAALTYNSANDKDKQDLRQAALQVSPQSPAYLSVRFCLVDALLKANRNDEARTELTRILQRKDLSPSNRNLFLTQKLSTSKNFSDYMKNAVQCMLIDAPYTNTTQMPENWYKFENQDAYVKGKSTIANDLVAEDMNINLPQSKWVALAKDPSLPQPLRSKFIRVAWLRSKLLEQNNPELDKLMAGNFPQLAGAIETYKSTGEERAKRFALACIVLNNYGMSPYIGGGIERHGELLNELDYYHTNFWMPYEPNEKAGTTKSEPPSCDRLGEGNAFLGAPQIIDCLVRYSKPVLNNILSSAEQREAASERKILNKNHPSRFFGEAVLDWARTHPTDARLPHMLYVVVKLPRWAGDELPYDNNENRFFKKELPVSSKYSRMAYLLLHEKYPHNKWTTAAPCWY